MTDQTDPTPINAALTAIALIEASYSSELNQRTAELLADVDAREHHAIVIALADIGGKLATQASRVTGHEGNPLELLQALRTAFIRREGDAQ